MLGLRALHRTTGTAGGSAAAGAVVVVGIVRVVVGVVEELADVRRGGGALGLVELGAVHGRGQRQNERVVVVVLVQVRADWGVGQRLFERETSGAVVFCVTGGELRRGPGPGRAGHCRADVRRRKMRRRRRRKKRPGGGGDVGVGGVSLVRALWLFTDEQSSARRQRTGRYNTDGPTNRQTETDRQTDRAREEK